MTGKYNDGVPEGSRFHKEQSFFKDSSERLKSEEGQKEIAIVRKLTKYAEDKFQCSVSQLALAWAAANPNVSTVILGATKPEQLKENFGAIPVSVIALSEKSSSAHAFLVQIIAKLTPEVLEEIEGILGNKPQPAPTYGR